MAKFSNPILFSTYFNVASESLTEGGLIDPFLTVDTQLFIDPILLEKSNNKTISVEAYQNFRKIFKLLYVF